MSKFIEVTDFNNKNKNVYLNVEQIISVNPELIKGLEVHGEVKRKSQMGTAITMSSPVINNSIQGQESFIYKIITTLSYDSIKKLIDK